MERWLRTLLEFRPEPVAAAAAALSALALAGVYGPALASGGQRGASLAAVGVFLLLVAIGVSLYAWRLGAPGRSD